MPHNTELPPECMSILAKALNSSDGEVATCVKCFYPTPPCPLRKGTIIDENGKEREMPIISGKTAIKQFLKEYLFK